MKYKFNNSKEYIINNNDFTKIKHNLGLYDMYMEYTKECKVLSKKEKELKKKIEMDEDKLLNITNKKNNIVYENEFHDLYLSLKNNYDEAEKNKMEFNDLINKFNEIDNIDNREEKEKIIKELNINRDYDSFKADIIKANEYNNKFLENISGKLNDILNDFKINKNFDLEKNKIIIKDVNKKIYYYKNKIQNNKKNIKKISNNIKGLEGELDNFLKMNNYETVNVYEKKLKKLKIILKIY